MSFIWRVNRQKLTDRVAIFFEKIIVESPWALIALKSLEFGRINSKSGGSLKIVRLA